MYSAINNFINQYDLKMIPVFYQSRPVESMQHIGDTFCIDGNYDRNPITEFVASYMLYEI